MAIPVGAHGTATYNTRQPGTSKSNQNAIKRAGGQAQSYQQNRGAQSAYLNQLAQLLYGQAGGGGSMGGGRRSGGGGGGGGGRGYDPYAAQRADEERRRAELEQRKAALTQQLGGARDAALPQLDQYRSQYNTDIGNIYGQNQALQGGYSQQLAALAAQMNQGIGGTMGNLQRDLQGQGAGSEVQAMQAAGQQAQQGNNFLSQNADAYNTRLAQMMAAAQADAGSMGAAIDTSARGQLQNSYMSLLAQIGMMGLL